MLLNALAQTFELAALRFQNTELKHSWIRYLPLGTEPCLALTRLGTLIQGRLRSASILESNSGELLSGSKATFVPITFRTRDGSPLLDDTTSLHKDYNDSDFAQLTWLGVNKMSYEKFLFDLRAYIGLESGRLFHMRDLTWHEDLAQVLDNSQEINSAQIAELPIIPLLDGRWVAAKNNIITFEPSDTAIMSRIPPGLDHVQMIHRSASSSSARLRLFQRLGVKQFDSKQVCNLIVAQHELTAKASYNLTVLISHAVYLFEANHNLKGLSSSENSSLWLCNSSGAIERASTLYIDVPGTRDPVRPHLVGGPAERLLLHQSIVEAVQGSKRSEWLRWLTDVLGVSAVLRVANASGRDITAEFAYFLENRLPSVSLGYLVKHWSILFPRDDVSKGVSRAVSSTHLKYDGQRKERLDMLSLDCKELRALAPKGLPFLDLPGIEDQSCQHLKHFGVGVPNHYHFVRHCIRVLMTRTSSLTMENVFPLYQYLQKCFARDEGDIR